MKDDIVVYGDKVHMLDDVENQNNEKEPVIDMYIDGFDYEYKIKKKNVQRKSENSKLI